MMGKVENAGYFPLNLHNFVNPFQDKPIVFTCLQYKSYQNTLGKGKLLVTCNFSFPTVFSIGLKNFLPFSQNSKLSSANSFSLEESKICSFGKS